MNKRQEQEIKFLQEHHFSADTIADSLDMKVETICDVLGYPHDLKGRVAAHKDYNFYEGDRAEYYGFFLEEGDFEKWQPVCYMDKSSDEFLKLQAEAIAIPQTYIPILEARRYWILLRFPEYQKNEFKVLRDKFVAEINKVEGIIVVKNI